MIVSDSKKNSTLIILIILVAIVFFQSCKKDSAQINFTEINSPYSGNLYSIKQTSTSVFYACGGDENSGAILKSTDGGNLWSIFKNFNHVIYDMQFTDSMTAFATGHDLTFYKSVDGGIVWNESVPDDSNRPLTGYLSEMYRIQMCSNLLGFACGGENFNEGVIYKTTDGINWKLTYKKHELRDLKMIDTLNGYASGYGVIYQTTDGGSNWIPTNAEDDFFTKIVFTDNESFACGYNGGIYRSTYFGDDWKKCESKNNAFSTRQHFNCMASFENENLVAAGLSGLISISHNGGDSWQSAESFNGTTIRSVILFSSTEGIAAGDGGKIFRFTY